VQSRNRERHFNHCFRVLLVCPALSVSMSGSSELLAVLVIFECPGRRLSPSGCEGSVPASYLVLLLLLSTMQDDESDSGRYELTPINLVSSEDETDDSEEDAGDTSRWRLMDSCTEFA